MPTALGAHSPQLEAVRALRTKRGRLEQQRFALEGPTLLAEAVGSGSRLEALYATAAAYEALDPGVRNSVGAPAYLVSERAMARISDVETPTGLLAVAPWQIEAADAVLRNGEAAMLLAGLGDPGNAGSLLRTAEIFGVATVLFGMGGVEPYNSKVVRASMGAIFRLRMGVVTPAEIDVLARRYSYTVVAADRTGAPLREHTFVDRSIIAIGSERTGVAGWLQRWDSAVSIPQIGPGESLNAAVAGSIVLYEFSRGREMLRKHPPNHEKP